MDPTEISAAKRMFLTCIECEERRNFLWDTGDAESMAVRYTCQECDHAVILSLDPDDGS